MAFGVAKACTSLGLAPSDMLPGMDNRSMSDVGGTPGGLGEFVLGFIMTCVGGYLLSNQVTVMGSYWSFWGANSFGRDADSSAVWRGHTLFQRTQHDRVGAHRRRRAVYSGRCNRKYAHLLSAATLFHTLVMLILLVGGLGLIARSMRSHHRATE